MLEIELPREIEIKIDELAASSGLTKSDWIRGAILEQLENQEDIRLAEESRKQGGRTYSLEEVERLLGLED